MTIDLAGKTSIADYMIIAGGTSGRHVLSIAENVAKQLKSNGIKGIEPEGKEQAEWVLLDAGDVIVHVFKPEAREKYDLETMWQIPVEKAKAGK